jgi:hypothetical protein
MTIPTRDEGRAATDRATPKDTSSKPDHIAPDAGAARFAPIGEVLPVLTPNVDFALADVDGDIYIAFRRCPCCGRKPRSKKVALMFLDHPALADSVGYLLDERCGRRLNGTSARSSEAARTVGTQVLAAVVAVKRMAGEPLPDALIVSDPAAVAYGSGVVQ